MERGEFIKRAVDIFVEAQRETDRAVFFNWNCHVDNFSWSVSASKVNFLARIDSDWCQYYEGASEVELSKLKMRLKEALSSPVEVAEVNIKLPFSRAMELGLI